LCIHHADLLFVAVAENHFLCVHQKAIDNTIFNIGSRVKYGDDLYVKCLSGLLSSATQKPMIWG
jgi:hypothetical protein